jgi:hypothetical protein
MGPDTVVAPSGRIELDADVAVAGNGSYVLAKMSAVVPAGAGPSEGSVTLTRYSAAGVQVGGPLTLDTFTYEPLVGFQGGVSAAIDADGDAVVAYDTRFGGGSAGFSDNVEFVRVSKSGVAATPVLLATEEDHVVASPDVSMDADGGFFVGWSKLTDVLLGTELGQVEASVHMRAFSASGTARGSAFVAASERATYDPDSETLPPTPQFVELDVAAGIDGSDARFAFTRVFGLSSRTIRYGLVTSSATVGAVRTADAGRARGRPALARYADGSFVIGYAESGTTVFEPTILDAFVQRYDAAGDPTGGRIMVAAPSGDMTIHSIVLDAMPDGGFVAGYHLANYELPSNMGRSSIGAVRYDASGAQDPAGHATVATGLGFDDSFVNPIGIGADDRGSAVMTYLTQDIVEAEAVYAVHFRRLAGDVAFNDRGDLYAFGTEGADHVIVERVGDNVFVNVNGAVKRFAGADVQFVSINGHGGDDDIINASALPSKIIGGHGADTLWGGTGPDLLLGFHGENHLRGGDGDDTLYGDRANELLHGGDGQDLLEGLGGEDTLTGGSGNDLLRGHDGSDRLFGEAGNDLLSGGFAANYLDGGAGDDSLYAGSGFEGGDSLFGMAGNDQLFDGIGPQTLRGGSGDDTAIIFDGDNDVLEVETVTSR